MFKFTHSSSLTPLRSLTYSPPPLWSQGYTIYLFLPLKYRSLDTAPYHCTPNDKTQKNSTDLHTKTPNVFMLLTLLFAIQVPTDFFSLILLRLSYHFKSRQFLWPYLNPRRLNLGFIVCLYNWIIPSFFFILFFFLCVFWGVLEVLFFPKSAKRMGEGAGVNSEQLLPRTFLYV